MGDGNRRRRAGMWIAGLAVVAGIAATYHLTRPPELVWWTSPIVGETGRRVHVVVPAGWRLEPPEPDHYSWADWTEYFDVIPDARQPRWIERILKSTKDSGDIFIGVGPPNDHPSVAGPTRVRPHKPGGDYEAIRRINYPECGLIVVINYRRTNSANFTATYRRICDSLCFE